MTLCGGAGGSLHDGCGLCTNLGVGGCGVGRGFDGFRRSMTEYDGGFSFFGRLLGWFGRIRGLMRDGQELYGRWNGGMWLAENVG